MEMFLFILPKPDVMLWDLSCLESTCWKRNIGYRREYTVTKWRWGSAHFIILLSCFSLSLEGHILLCFSSWQKLRGQGRLGSKFSDRIVIPVEEVTTMAGVWQNSDLQPIVLASACREAPRILLYLFRFLPLRSFRFLNQSEPELWS